jgi:phytoene desaturase
MGPSWYLMPEIAEKIFNILGYKTSDFFKLKSLSTKYKIFFEDKKSLILTDSIKENLDSFETVSPGSTKKIKELIEKTSLIYNIAVNDFLNQPYQKLTDFLRQKELKNALKLLKIFNPFENYHAFINRHVKDPKLQKVFEFHTVFLGGDPYHTPALYSMLIAADFNQKVWYPMGGVGKLVSALENICKDLSVEIIKDAKVSEINIDKKSSKILSVSGQWGSVTTDYVVNTMDYATFDQKLLPDKYREYSNKYWEEKDYSISTILVYLGINKKFKAYFCHHQSFYYL